jgi:hypothetical protein
MLHATPWFPVSFVKLAVNLKVCPWSMLGGLAGVIATATREPGAGWLLPQPHINTSIESTSASFFIISAVPLP